MKELIGKEVRGLFMAPDQSATILATDSGCIKFPVYGDCCSESWYSDIYNFDGLMGKVVSAEEIEMPDYNVNDGRCRQEEDSAYGYKVQTDKGTATIVFRNSSNGYYGGSMEDAVALDVVPEDYQKITSDWKA